MSSKKSRKSKLSDSDSDSGPDDRNPPAKKVKNEKVKDEKPAAASSTSDDGASMFKLARNRFVNVREFRGKVLVDIREFYDKDGKTLPGKKGIALSMEQWNALKEQMDDIEAAIKQF